jgi:hypothetical protein
MFGEEEVGQPHSNKEAALLIAYEAAGIGLLSDMVSYLGMLEFESRKDLAAIFSALVRIDNSGDLPGLRYILENDQILLTLFEGCASREEQGEGKWARSGAETVWHFYFFRRWGAGLSSAASWHSP